MNSKKVTMQEIANQLGITKVSVSKALNNQPGVSAELKQRILEVTRELGYFNNKQKKASLDIKKLGFLVSKRFFLENDNFYTKIYYSLGRECAKKEINLFLFIINSNDESDLSIPFSIRQDNLDGLFIAGEIKDAYIHTLLHLGIPITAIDFYKPNLNLDCVVTDNFYASSMATNYLIQQGHRNIGFVGNPNFTSSVMDRYYGYLKALNENNLSYNTDWHIVNNDSSGFYTIDFKLPDSLPTAFLCHCDMAAYHLMLKLQSVGISVPEQVSIISFDNTELSKNCSPSLTTINIDTHEFALKSLQHMLWKKNAPSSEAQRIFISTNLIERNSVKKLDRSL